MATPSSRGITRRKPKRKPDRYNPNAPDWRAVHAPRYTRIPAFAPLALFAALFTTRRR